jgi:hypothetical protein
VMVRRGNDFGSLVRSLWVLLELELLDYMRSLVPGDEMRRHPFSLNIIASDLMNNLSYLSPNIH